MVLFIGAWIGIFGFVFLWYIVAKIKQKKDFKIKNGESIDEKHIKTLVAKLKKQMNEISLGVFGNFNKNNIGIEDLVIELNHRGVDKEEQFKIATQVIEKWKNLIESNSQYIVNLFMTYPITGIELDEYWDNWCFSEEEKKLNEEKLNILREQKEKQIQSELAKYSDKENPKDIAELYRKHFPYFNYNDFIKSITLEYLHLDLDEFSIQLSDKNMDLLCVAYLVFNHDLKDYDWHNF